MVQKYSRAILTLMLCSLLVAFFGGSVFAHALNEKRWAQNLIPNIELPFWRASPSETTKPTEAQNPTLSYKRYVALGDSVAAGSGLEILNTDPKTIECARSTMSYPEIVANRLQSQLLFNACGGASTTDILALEPFTSPTNLTHQLILAYASGTPDLITITIGANDIGWIPAINDCFEGNCVVPENTSLMKQRLAIFESKLTYILRSVMLLSNSQPPRIILTGYYTLGSNKCLASISKQSVTPREASWLRAQTDQLNMTIQHVSARFPNTHYAAIDSSQHGLCAHGGERWVQNLNDPAPFHLTASGEKAMADAIYKELSKQD